MFTSFGRESNRKNEVFIFSKNQELGVMDSSLVFESDENLLNFIEKKDGYRYFSIENKIDLSVRLFFAYHSWCIENGVISIIALELGTEYLEEDMKYLMSETPCDEISLPSIFDRCKSLNVLAAKFF